MRRVFPFIILVMGSLLVFMSTYGWRSSETVVAIQSTRDKKMAKRLEKYVYTLSQQIGWRSIDEYENLQKSAKYIYNHFSSLGFRVRKQAFLVRGKNVYNIIAEKRGLKDPEKIIVIGAHYDAHLNPGADRNASGIAAILELAKSFENKKIDRTIHFVAFVNAEPPFFETDDMGSLRYIKQIEKDGGQIDFAIILDSIGYFTYEDYSQRYPPLLGVFFPSKGNFIAVVGNSKIVKLTKTVEGHLKKIISFPVRFVFTFGFVESDHWSFWKKGYPAILITDTGRYRNPYYRSLSDTYEKLNYQNIVQIVRGLSFTIDELDTSYAVKE